IHGSEVANHEALYFMAEIPKSHQPMGTRPFVNGQNTDSPRNELEQREGSQKRPPTEAALLDVQLSDRDLGNRDRIAGTALTDLYDLARNDLGNRIVAID